MPTHNAPTHPAYPGEPEIKFAQAMEAEHCGNGACCRAVFRAPNYGIETTTSREWNIVVRGAMCPQHQLGHGRRIPDIAILECCDAAVAAGLRREEVIALVLYTGPMVRLPLLSNTRQHLSMI